jgi:hypothetical protein
MKKTMTLIFAAASLSFGATAFAQDRDYVTTLTECGIGAMISPTNDTVAIITNVTWDLGTTAVSSNMSSAENCKGGQKKVAQLIQNAYPQLTADIAKGQGKNLDALSVAAQCGPTAGDKFKTQVRYQFGQLAAQGQGKTQLDKNEDLYGIVKSSAVHAGCTI